MENINEGPSTVRVPAQEYKSCSGCCHYSSKLVVSGRYPKYRKECTHHGAVYGNLDGEDRTPEWCPVLKSIRPAHRVKFPDVIFTGSSISTWVRKKHTDGKWYLCLVHHYIYTEPTNENIQSMLQQFNKSVLAFLLFGEIDPAKTIGPNNDFVYSLDADQRNEDDRLLNEYKKFVRKP